MFDFEKAQHFAQGHSSFVCQRIFLFCFFPPSIASANQICICWFCEESEKVILFRNHLKPLFSIQDKLQLTSRGKKDKHKFTKHPEIFTPTPLIPPCNCAFSYLSKVNKYNVIMATQPTHTATTHLCRDFETPHQVDVKSTSLRNSLLCFPFNFLQSLTQGSQTICWKILGAHGCLPQCRICHHDQNPCDFKVHAAALSTPAYFCKMFGF